MGQGCSLKGLMVCHDAGGQKVILQITESETAQISISRNSYRAL